ncbi:MAG: glycosyltransferase [Candidatus Sumerlaeota bacterium]|nr:glycosyltransferase [Candidatus Sumerlaeota bacterium]
MRILVITNMYPRSDAPWYGIFVQEQVEALRAAGLGVDVQVIEGWKGPFEYWSSATPIAAQLAEKSYSLVHAHHGYAGWVALRCLRAMPRAQRPPLIVTLHDGDLFAPKGTRVRLGHRLTRYWRLRVARKASLVITVNPDHQIRGARVICLPCGVDMDKFTPMEQAKARRMLGDKIPPDKPRWLFPADPFRPEKRFDLASHALAAYCKRAGQTAIVTGGDIPPDEMPLHYNAADLVILLSDYEASPMVLKEALACERPIVARRVGDAERLLQGIEGAYLCGDDPASIAEAATKAMQKPRSVGGRKRLEELGMTQKKTIQRLMEIYREIA